MVPTHRTCVPYVKTVHTLAKPVRIRDPRRTRDETAEPLVDGHCHRIEARSLPFSGHLIWRLVSADRSR